MWGITLAFVILGFQLVRATPSQSFDFHVEQTTATLSPGLSKQKLLVNGLFPGPLIRVPVNTQVTVNVYNHLECNATTIHWHGLHQIKTPYYDGFATQSQCPIPPLSNMSYSFQAFPAGSTFWHAHFHGENADGIYGAFVVEDAPGSFPFPYDEERVIVMTDAYNLSFWDEQNVVISNVMSAIKNNVSIGDPKPDQNFVCVYDESTSPATPSCSSTMDGNGFNLQFEEGKIYRLRLICSAELAPFLFSIDEHEMQLVSVDYTVVDSTAWIQSVPLMSGQRYDVLVRAKENVQPGQKFWVRASVQSQCVAAYPDASCDVRGILSYGGDTSSTLPTSTSWNASNPDCVDVDYSLLKPAVVSEVSEHVGLMFLNYTFSTVINGFPYILIDDNNYNVNDSAYPTLFNVNENPSWTPTAPGEQRNLFVVPDQWRNQEFIVILNSLPARDGRNHPFHRHGGGFKVLASGTSQITLEDVNSVRSVDIENAIIRDTVVVPKDGWVISQYVSYFPVQSLELDGATRWTADNPGVWAFYNKS